MPGGRIRFSLAGGQDKWPVYYEDGQLSLPEGELPSSHILKFDSLRYKGTGWDEAFTSFLEGKLDVPVVKVLPFSGYTLTERYDRRRKPDGSIERIHQEDFCQALGLHASRKYEAEGGPSFSQCFALVRRISSVPAVDTIKLIRWQIANVLIGNADGHAKNLSVLYDGSQCRLAPFYDLVCTNIYPGISRDLAMAVGHEHVPGQIRKKNWQMLAEDVGIKPRVVFRLLDEMTTVLSTNLMAWTKEFTATNGTNPVIDRVRVYVQDQVRRTRLLAFEGETTQGTDAAD